MGYLQRVKTKIVYRDTVISKMVQIKNAPSTNDRISDIIKKTDILKLRLLIL